MITVATSLLFNSIILVSLILPLNHFYTKKYVPLWNLRDYGITENEWKGFLKNSIIFSIFILVATTLLSYETFFVITFSLITYYLTLSAQSDHVSHYIPYDITNHFIVLSIILGCVGITLKQFQLITIADDVNITTQFIIFQSVITLWFLVNLFLPISGFADIKIFWGLGFSYAWYSSLSQLYGFVFLTSLLLLVNMVTNKLYAKENSRKKKHVAMLPAITGAFLITVLL